MGRADKGKYVSYVPARNDKLMVLRIYLKKTHVIPKEPFGSAQDKLRD